MHAPSPTAQALPAGGLKRRHLSMIAIGGIIGSGLFVGSSAAIAATGPAIVVSYLLAGILILLVMRDLERLAHADPERGPFTEHIRAQLGDWAGFSCGWMYWFFWVLALALEGLAGAGILAHWIGVPVPLIAAGLIVLVTALNLLSTRSFGEAEFWLSLAKVIAICVFIAIGLYWCFGLVLETGALPANLTRHGGFIPFGAMSIPAGVTSVVLALVGAEIVTVAAAESEPDERKSLRLSTTLVVRILVFYVLSMAIIVSVVPWTRITSGSSPFALALVAMDFPGVSLAMNLVILVAVLSCMNSGVFVCSRMLGTLAQRGEAPRALAQRTPRGVPMRAILTASAIGLLCVVAAIAAPGKMFAFLVNAAGAIMLVAYLLLVLAHAVWGYRRGMRLGLGIDALVVAAMLAVMVAMALSRHLAPQIHATLALLAGLLIVHGLRRRRTS